MKDEFKILYTLVCTFCFCIVIGMFGVWAGKVDAQFVEGLISGGLVGMITMLFKDVLNEPKETITQPKIVPPAASTEGK